MLWIPGPTEVRPEILAECALPMVGHRSRAMAELIERIDPHLPHLFGLESGSDARAAVASCSASGLMEGAVRGIGERVLNVVNGAFSKRWHAISKSVGLEAVALEVEWGHAVDDMELARVLDEQGPFDAVTLVANETSTGAYTEIRTVANVLMAFPDTLLLVDVVSLIAGGPVDFDENLVDFMLAGVQKALSLPPGISVFSASPDWIERMQGAQNRGWYLDPVRALEGHEARKTPATPCIPLYRALAKQLEDIAAGVTLPEADRGREGRDAWTARYEKHERMRDEVLDWAARHGFEPFPAPGHRSPTVACLRASELDIQAFVDGLKQRELEISNGYGPLKNQTFRIGHMGDRTEAELAHLLAQADEVLAGPN